MSSGWGSLNNIIEEAKRRKEEEDARRAYEQQRAMERQDLTPPPVQGPPQRFDQPPSLRPRPNVTVYDNQPQPEYGVSRPQTDTGVPDVGMTQTFGVEEEEDTWASPNVQPWQPGTLQPGQQGPQTLAGSQQQPVKAMGINLAGVIPPTGLPIVDHVLGLGQEAGQPDRAGGWNEFLANEKAGWNELVTDFTQDIPEWFNRNPNIMYAEDRGYQRQQDLESGAMGNNAAKWRMAGEILKNTGVLGLSQFGSMMEWVNRKENLAARNRALNALDYAGEAGLIAATTPFNQMRLGLGAEAYDVAPGPSIASIVAPIGAGLNRALNPLNPNFEGRLWGNPKVAQQFSQESLNASPMFAFREGIESKFNWAMDSIGIPVHIEMNNPVVAPKTAFGRFFNAVAWAGWEAFSEAEQIGEAMQIIHEGAKVDPRYAMFGRNAWSSSDKMLSGYNTAFNRQSILTDMGQEYMDAYTQGDFDKAALLYYQMQDLSRKSFSQIMEENQNPWAEVVAGIFFDVGPTGWLGDKVGDAIRGVSKGMRAAHFAKIFNISDEVGTAQIDLALSNSKGFLRGLTGATDSKQIRQLWDEIIQPYRGLGETLAGIGKTPVTEAPFALTQESKAEIDADILLRSLQWILKDVTTKEDVAKVMQTLLTNPSQLIRGIDGLNSPNILQISPQGIMKWGGGVVGNKELARRFPILAMARNAIANMDSLKGTGRINGEQFMTELAGILYDQSRVVNGLGDSLTLPMGAVDVRLVTNPNGTAGYEYVNKNGKRIFLSQEMTAAEAQNFVRSVKSNWTLKKTGEMILTPATLALGIQKKLMTDMFLFYRPANWIRNAASGTMMLLAEGAYGQYKHADMDAWFIGKIGTAETEEGVSGVSQGMRQQFSGLIDAVVGKVAPNSKVSKALKATQDIPYGETYIAGTNIPFGEKALRKTSRYHMAHNAFSTSWGQYTKGVRGELSKMGLDGNTVDKFVNGLYEVGLRGSKQDVLAYVKNFAESGRFRVTLTSLGLPDDVLDNKTYAAIANILNTYSLDQYEDAMREVVKAVREQRKSTLELLRSTPKQVGDFNWMKQEIPDQAQKLADLQRRYALRQGANAADATQRAQQTADQFLTAHARAFDNFRQGLRDSGNNGVTWAVVSDYYNEWRRMTREANRSIDNLVRQSQGTGLWDDYETAARQIYDRLSTDVQTLGQKYRTILNRTKGGAKYAPRTRGWAQVLEEDALFDRAFFDSIQGYAVKGTEDPRYAQKVAAWRQYVEHSTAKMVEVFRRFPSSDNFDMMTQTFEELGQIGKFASDKMVDIRNARKLGRISDRGYYNVSNMTWEQAFGYMSAHAEATGRAMLSNSIINSTSETLRFRVGKKDYLLYAPKDANTWWGMSLKDGSLREFNSPTAQMPNPKLPTMPEGAVAEYFRLTNGKPAATVNLDAEITAAANAVAPRPTVVPPPNVQPVKPPATSAAPSAVPSAGQTEQAIQDSLTARDTLGMGLIADNDVAHILQPNGKWKTVTYEELAKQVEVARAKGKPIQIKIKGRKKATAAATAAPEMSALDRLAERITATESMNHEQLWAKYVPQFQQRGWSVPELQDLSEDEFRWAAQELEMGRGYRRGVDTGMEYGTGRGVDTGIEYGPTMPPAPDTWKTPDRLPYSPLTDAGKRRIYPLNYYDTPMPEKKIPSAPGVLHPTGRWITDPPPLTGPNGKPMILGKGRPPVAAAKATDWRSKMIEEARRMDALQGPQQKPKLIGVGLDPWGEDVTPPVTTPRTPAATGNDAKPFEEIWEAPPARRGGSKRLGMPSPQRIVPPNYWQAPKLGRAEPWDRTENVIYYVGRDPYLRMRLRGGAKLLPPGVPGIQAQGGHWVRDGNDLLYVLPVQPEEMTLTPAGIRKKSSDVLQDLNDLLGAPEKRGLGYSKLPDAQGRFYDDPDYEFWTKDAAENEAKGFRVEDLLPISPGEDGEVLVIKNGDRLDAAFGKLKPPPAPAKFDDLAERWRLPSPADRRGRVVRTPIDREATTLSYKNMPSQTTPVELVAKRQGDRYVITFSDGRLASSQKFKTRLEAEDHADLLMTEGIGVSGEGYVVQGKGWRRRLPKLSTSMADKKFAREYVKGMTPEEILAREFIDDADRTLTGRELLKMSGYQDVEIQSWLLDAKNGRRKLLDALEASLGMRPAVGGDQDIFFYGGLPIPPEVLGFFRGAWEDGVAKLAGDILGGVFFSQRTRPFRPLSASDLALHELSSLDEIEQALTDPVTMQTILGGVDGRVSNGQRRSIMSLLDGIGKAHDNTTATSMSLADDATNWAMLDFRKKRNVDFMFNMAAPFSFYATRMPGRGVLAAFKRPSFIGAYYDLQRGIESENDSSGVPDRLRGTLPIPGTDYRVQVQRLLTDIVPGMMYLAADTFMRPEDIFDDDGKIDKGEALLMALDTMQIGTGPLQRLTVDLVTDGDFDEMLTMGSMVPWWKAGMYGRMAVTGQLEQQGWMMGGTPYDAGIVGRNINARMGVGVDTEAYARAQAMYDARGQTAPEGAIPPEAQALYQEVAKETGAELFWRTVTGNLFTPVTRYTEEEAAQQQMAQNRRNIGYRGGENPAGSRAATRQYDERTNYEGRDFKSYVGMYDASTTPDESLAQAQNTELYLRQKDIDTRYEAEEEAYRQQNPNVERGDYWDFIFSQDDKRKAERAALEAELPLGATYYDTYAQDIDRYAAENPQELQVAAFTEAKRQAEADLAAQGITRPERLGEGATREERRITSRQQDEYDAQVDALAQQYVEDPEWVQTQLGGRDPQTGQKVGAAAAPIPAAAATNQPQGEAGNRAVDRQPYEPFLSKRKPVVRKPIFEGEMSSFAPDPANQWADKMAEQEELYGLPSGILQEIARRESNFTPDITNDYGMQGMYQFDPDTWGDVSQALGVTDPYDPDQAIEAAAYYLDWINSALPEDKRGDPFWMAAAYNSGIGAVMNMTSREDILNLQYGTNDNAARLRYATEIANTVGGAVPQATTAQTATVPAQSYTNPNWGDRVGDWTVVGDPITDTGLTWVSPVPEGSEVYQHYGETDVDGLGAYYASKNQGFGHEGVDWMLPEGTAIGAISEGTVVFVGDGKDEGRPAYGNMVVIEHPNGMKSRYGHLSGFNVEVGDTVTPGQEIGYVGHTPLTSNIGDHLHLSVESPNEQTGPYNTIDPFRLIGVGANPDTSPYREQIADVAPTATQKPLAAQQPQSGQAGTYNPRDPASGFVLPPPAGASEPVPTNMAEYRQYQNEVMYPQTESEKAITGRFAAQDAAGQALVNSRYKQYVELFNQYDAMLYDDERKAFMRQHPQLKALNMAAYEPEMHAEIERLFGPNAVMRWAMIPLSEKGGGVPGERAAYYQGDPSAIVIKSWIEGRPGPYDEDKEFEGYDFGQDYAEAEERFGGNIWDVVREYQMLPDDGSFEARKTRAIWHERNPQYRAWSDWWYAAYENPYATTASSGSGYGYSGGSRGGGYSGGSRTYVEPFNISQVRAQGFEMARARRRGGDNQGWRKWLALSGQKSS